MPTREMRQKLFEHLQSLTLQLDIQRGEPGDISARTCKVRDDTGTHRLAD
jgi:hypothetical protein